MAAAHAKKNESDKKHSNEDESIVIHGKRIAVWRRDVGNGKK